MPYAVPSSPTASFRKPSSSRSSNYPGIPSFEPPQDVATAKVAFPSVQSPLSPSDSRLDSALAREPIASQSKRVRHHSRTSSVSEVSPITGNFNFIHSGNGQHHSYRRGSPTLSNSEGSTSKQGGGGGASNSPSGGGLVNGFSSTMLEDAATTESGARYSIRLPGSMPLRPKTTTSSEEARQQRKARLYGYSSAIRDTSRSASSTVAAVAEAAETIVEGSSSENSEASPAEQDIPRSVTPTNDIPFPSASPGSPPPVNHLGLSFQDAEQSGSSSDSPSLPFPSSINERFRAGVQFEFEANSKNFPRMTLPAVRKKSGELVKSSLKGSSPESRLRAKSAPSTPTGPKFVHFDSHLEHVKHFLTQQRPTAVSRDGSPIETETEEETDGYPFPQMPGVVSRRLVNFPVMTPKRASSEAYLQSLDMAPGAKSLRGVVMVKNLAFQKLLAVRFTFDNWQTVSEVSGDYIESLAATQYDRFGFTIKLHDMIARIESKTLFLCIRYTVGGKEYWDNNSGANYQVVFQKPSASRSTADSKPAQSWTVRNEAETDGRIAELRRQLSKVAEDENATPKIVLKSQRPGSIGSSLSTRYDFGASLRNSIPSSRPCPSRSLLNNPYFFTGDFGAPEQSFSMPKPSFGGDVSPIPGDTPPAFEGGSSRLYATETEDSGSKPSPLNTSPAEGSETTPRISNATSSTPSHEWPQMSQNEDHESRQTRFHSFPPQGMHSNELPSTPTDDLVSRTKTSPPMPPVRLSESFHSSQAVPGPAPLSEGPDHGSPLFHEAMLSSPGPSPALSESSSSLTSSPDSPLGIQTLDLSPGERPHIASPTYSDFVNKFCFFGGEQKLPSFGLKNIDTSLRPTRLSPPASCGASLSSGSNTPSPSGGSPVVTRSDSPLPTFTIPHSAVLSI